MRLAMKATSKKAFAPMEDRANDKNPVTFEDLQVGDPEHEEIAIEMYGVICMTVAGEALTIVRGVIDMNGTKLKHGDV